MTTDYRTMTQDIAFAARIRAQLEKTRVSIQVHLAHLEKHGRDDPLAREVFPDLVSIEDRIEDRIQEWTRAHPVWTNWAQHVRGVGPMNLGAVMSRCTAIVDPIWHEERQEWKRLDTISQLWAHLGLAPGQRRKAGEKLDFDFTGRVWAWRLADGLVKQGRSFKAVYDRRKEHTAARVAAAGGQLVPEAKGKEVKTPDFGVGHAHQDAMRVMLKTFTACMWLVWREAEGLPTAPPYIIGRADGSGHVHTHVYRPEEFLDYPKDQPDNQGHP